MYTNMYSVYCKLYITLDRKIKCIVHTYHTSQKRSLAFALYISSTKTLNSGSLRKQLKGGMKCTLLCLASRIFYQLVPHKCVNGLHKIFIGI